MKKLNILKYSIINKFSYRLALGLLCLSVLLSVSCDNDHANPKVTLTLQKVIFSARNSGSEGGITLSDYSKVKLLITTDEAGKAPAHYYVGKKEKTFEAGGTELTIKGDALSIHLESGTGQGKAYYVRKFDLDAEGKTSYRLADFVSFKLKDTDASKSVTLALVENKTKVEGEKTTDKSAFISVWNTHPKLELYGAHSKNPSRQNQIKLPLVPEGSYNFTVDWGDDTSDRITEYNAQEAKHSYAKEGIYTVSIKGKLKGWAFGYIPSQDDKKWSYYGDAEKLTEIKKWGNLDFGESGYQFYSATHMVVTATDIPKFSTSSFKAMFKYCKSLKGIPGMNKWDVSGVTDMSEMFRYATLFNEDISSWDVSKVTDMSSMFSSAEKFNQPIGSWNVSKVTNMDMLFYHAKKFNQAISSWKVQNVTNMRAMFDEAESFDQDISSWNVSKVETMQYMFRDAASFNQNIGSWDVSSVKNMESMFSGAELFNQDLNDWDVSNVTKMSSMFAIAHAFNGDISSWNVSNVTTMYNMFNGCHSFNGDLSRWNVSNVNNMQWMFYETDSFNSDISRWNVSKVTAMFRMFYSATSFDQNIGSWDISKVFQMDDMFWGVTLSTQNYNALLKGFSVKGCKFPTKYHRTLNFHGGFSKYTADYKQYRDKLIKEKGWTITDGGQED